jgi:hypothetical protein
MTVCSTGTISTISVDNAAEFDLRLVLGSDRTCSIQDLAFFAAAVLLNNFLVALPIVQE